MTDIGMTTEDSAALREHVDAALHQWWNDDHDDGSSHHCRPVPTEDEFLAALASQGYTIVRSAELERLRSVETAARGHVDWEYRRRGAPRVTLTDLRAALSREEATSE